MSLGTTLRVGLALLGVTMAGACAQRELDKKPELAQEHGYYVPYDEARARGGVGGYVDVPSNSERDSLNATSNQAGVAATEPEQPTEAMQATEEGELQPSDATAESESISKSSTVAVLEESPQTILFDTGDATLREESMSVLDEIAMQLKDADDVTVKVEGFADKTGNPEANKQLSEERANAVSEYLTAQGAPMEKLEVDSYGDEQATSEGANPEDRKVVISLG